MDMKLEVVVVPVADVDRAKEVDVERALVWRDFMVPDYSDAGGSAGWPQRPQWCCPVGAVVPAGESASRATARSRNDSPRRRTPAPSRSSALPGSQPAEASSASFDVRAVC
ncbi:hypothetical protein ABIA33_001529 [Streptacidiphilus sp. MAP12-16]|uniref:hypothetical protein n=1 Tax=Streptacidiphilus sp. MAP12-16 TaxID=3156300 RepID=UPI0035132A9E